MNPICASFMCGEPRLVEMETWCSDCRAASSFCAEHAGMHAAHCGKLALWRQKKEKEYEDEASDLKEKMPARGEFDAWMDVQCDKAIRAALEQPPRPVNEKSPALGTPIQGRKAWANGLTKELQYKWLTDCWRMRQGDEMQWGGQGVFVDGPDSYESMVHSFMFFCKLCARNKVVPSNWDWSAFLRNPRLDQIVFLFEKSDAQDEWGGENYFAPMTGSGRSLRYTAECVYGSTIQNLEIDDVERQLRNWVDGFDSDDPYHVEEEVEDYSDTWDLLSTPRGNAFCKNIGGRHEWQELFRRFRTLITSMYME
jgi:hypothetical protein